MNRFSCITLVAVLSVPLFGQAIKDRNLTTMRRHGTQSTVLAPHTSPTGSKDTNSQLDKLEHQTANTVIQPAAKTPKVQAYKLPPEPKPAADNFYPQSMPTRSGLKNTPGSGSSNRSRSNRVSPYKR